MPRDQPTTTSRIRPFCCCLFVLLCTSGLRAERPNIVLFLVDDMGWQDTSVPFHSERTRLNDHFRTPNMERLARQGCKFTQAYAAAVCSPTRTAIMTGQNPLRHKVTNWTLHKDGETSGTTDRLAAPADWNRNGLQPGTTTLPQLLQEAGYYTIHAGKAHWGAWDTPGSDPRNLGFDVNIAGHAAGGPGGWYGKDNFGNHPDGRHKRPWGIPGLEKYHGQDVHLTDVTTIEALEAVKHAVRNEQPFYLYLAHYAVHAPIRPHPPHDAAYRGTHYTGTDIPIPPVEADYASMVAGMDASLGQVLDALEDLGVAENTIVLFSSDNGGLSIHARSTSPYGEAGDHHNRPLREGKGSAYEGGTRVPMLVSWARLDAGNAQQQRIPIQPGSDCRIPNICEDYYPTVCRWAGIADRLTERRDLDGRDITDDLTGEASEDEDRALNFHYPHVWGPRGPGYQPHSSIRVGDWKAIYFYGPQRWELYNLRDDLPENNDLAASQPQRLRALAGRMRAEHQRLGAQYPMNRETDAAEPPIWPD